jgi:hypothetical protein
MRVVGTKQNRESYKYMFNIGGYELCDCNRVTSKAVNREDKRSRRYRDRDFAKFERSRRYRDRYRC